MENTFKFIPITLALLFGSAVLARESVTCTIEKGWFDSDVCIAVYDSQITKPMRFVHIPVTEKDKKYLVTSLNEQIKKLTTEACGLYRQKIKIDRKVSNAKEAHQVLQKAVQDHTDKYVAKHKEIIRKTNALKEIVALLDRISNSIIECKLQQEYDGLKDDKELVKEISFSTFANYKKMRLSLFKIGSEIRYLENEARENYLEKPFKVVANNQISNNLCKDLEKLDKLCRENFRTTFLQGSQRGFFASLLTSKLAWISVITAGLGYTLWTK